MHRAITSQISVASPPRMAISRAILEHEISELRLILERYAGTLIDVPREQLMRAFRELLEGSQYASAADLLEKLPSSDESCIWLLENLLDVSSAFFRFPGVFRVFEQKIMPELHARKSGQSPRSLRIWSAGCGTGEEAYSIAMSVCRTVNCGGGGWNVHILASDIRRRALVEAERGLYPREALADIPNSLIKEYFSKVGEHFLVKPRLRNLLTFTHANLAQSAYIGRFDCIFCIDVLPHFSSSQRVALVERLQLYLEPGGYLLLGEGERLSGPPLKLVPKDEPSIYRKPLVAAAKSSE